jgi:hypothetical protein
MLRITPCGPCTSHVTSSALVFLHFDTHKRRCPSSASFLSRVIFQSSRAHIRVYEDKNGLKQPSMLSCHASYSIIPANSQTLDFRSCILCWSFEHCMIIIFKYPNYCHLGTLPLLQLLMKTPSVNTRMDVSCLVVQAAERPALYLDQKGL